MKLDHIVLMVRSLEASLGWYTALLPLIGFTKTRDHVWSNTDDMAIEIKTADANSRSYERYGPGLNHLGFAANSANDLEQIRRAMTEGGFSVPPEQQFGADRALFLKDPDGIRIEVTAYA